MKAECPMGHTENLSWKEVYGRLITNDFDCQTEDCSKEVSLEVDRRFWEQYFPEAIYFDEEDPDDRV